ncbi:MAG: 5-formyltetrahydrofolate cyclo-ligase [Bacteroidales bacterium]|jgi:5-formyltetrahydrofolate cyclo-ligase|nr:5-formyltetrahydrofolate cyclo-ligase [Bacteroidales bacterium]
MNKKELRQDIRAAKKLHTPEELLLQSEVILRKLAQHLRFLEAERVMLYASLPDEVQTLSFLETWRHRKTVILPTVVGDDIIPVELAENVEFAEGDFHIPEPQNHPYTGDFDLIVVPGMAFDKAGHRLGRGKGYYDRFLSQHPQVYTIGLCFDFQLLPEVPFEPHDCLINDVITL